MLGHAANDKKFSFSFYNLTFIANFFDGRSNFHKNILSLQSFDYPSLGKIIGTHFNHNAVARKKPDIIHSHPA